MKNNKSLGQHWLKNRAILDEIADLAAVPADSDTLCIEIGPGLGTLTSSLLKRFSRVIAIEFDEKLAHNLPGSFPGKNLQVIHGDVLQTDISGLAKTSNYVVAGNIPYYITSPIIHKLIFDGAFAPQRIVLLVQKEVAERIAAAPGHHTLLSLTVQNRAAVELGPVVRGAEFVPPPKVDSEVLILDPLSAPLIPDSVFKLIKIGFSSPRKKLIHNLAAGTSCSKTDWQGIFAGLNLDPDARPGDLELSDWQALFQVSDLAESST